MQDDKPGKLTFTATMPGKGSSKTPDEVLVDAALAALGLNTVDKISGFSAKYGYKDFRALCLAHLRSQKMFTDRVKLLRQHGTITTQFDVPGFLITQITTYLAGAVSNLARRQTDARHQEASGIVDGAVGAVRNQLEAVGDYAQGAIKVFEGAVEYGYSKPGSPGSKRGSDKIVEGRSQALTGAFVKPLQTTLDVTLFVLGKAASGFQTRVGLEDIGVPLTPGEIALLTPIFGSSIIYSLVRIKKGYAGLASFGEDVDPVTGQKRLTFNNTRALTFGNTIYMKNSPNYNSTLVHETTHVWQHQNGGTDYMSEALHAQLFGDGYGYGEAITKQKKTWYMLNPEQQASLIQNAFDNGYFQNGGWSNVVKVPDGAGSTVPPQFLINYMKAATSQLRGGQGAT